MFHHYKCDGYIGYSLWIAFEILLFLNSNLIQSLVKLCVYGLKIYIN